jgi:hypothetical protein
MLSYCGNKNRKVLIMNNLRCAIYGAGSLGTVLGAYITKNGGKIDLFKFDLKEMKQYLLTGERRRFIIQADCYFALDYNCEGGFKFRPDE